MKQILAFAFTFLQIFIFVNANGIYSIVAPGTLQPNYDYSVSVTLHENSEPAVIKVGITGPSYNETQILNVAPAQTKVANFEIPQLKNGDYKLETEGIKGLLFKNSTDLNFKNKEPKIYIQTDKATYKPGDLVQYRIIVLDEETRPAKLNKPFRLGFKDGAGNVVKQINDVELTKGVHSGEFQLSEQPVLGDWIMKVILGPHDDDTKAEKRFEVAKYVLPKFSVDIETAKDIAFSDPLKITVRSKYTYGKPVKGQATIIVEAGDGKSSRSEKMIDIDGKGYIEFDLSQDLKIDSFELVRGYHSVRFYAPSLHVLVIMTEEYTGSKQNKSAIINLHNSHYNIEVPNSIYKYTVNKTFEYKVFVKNLDGSPVQKGKEVAKLIIEEQQRHFGHQSDEEKFVFTSELDEHGMALFKVTLPSAGYGYNARVTYADQIRHLPSLFDIAKKEETKNDNKPKIDEDVGPMKLVQKTEKPRLDEDVVVEVKSNENIPHYVYSVVARGNIIKQEHIKLPENVKSHEIKIKPSFKMVPQAYLYVYFVRNGELKFQEMSLNFPKEFLNKMEITAPKQVKPGEEVTLNIKTDPESYIGLLGIDQSVLLLKSGNDLDSTQILNDLNSYDSSTPYVAGYGEYPGQSAGLVTLTNANYPYSTVFYPPFLNIPQPLGPGPINFRVTAFGAGAQIPLMARPQFAGFPGPIPPAAPPTYNIEPKIRKEFIENWIFNNINKYARAKVFMLFIRYTYICGLKYTGVDDYLVDYHLLYLDELTPHVFDGEYMRPSYEDSVDSVTSDNKLPVIRENFKETWIYENFINTDANGLATFTKNIPDTITSWVVTGFSLNDKTGFGMTANPTNIEVFQPFFISTSLPYSVKRGEVISIPIVIFNYMDKALDAEVTMENTDEEYDFTEVSNETEELVLEEKERMKRVSIPSNGGKSVSFMIRPNKVGEITLKIKAITPLAGDAMHQKLKVEPEGVTQYENQAIFITPSSNKEASKEILKAVIPEEAVLDSEYLEFSVVGDILGPTIKNIDKLVRMPYGCGEQNMINFVPNILVLQYLDAIKREMPNVVDNAKRFMEVGYQRELTYKHKNGAYSAFGEGSSEASSWLTAYVARSFIRAKRYISIDQEVIDDALKYLISTQQDNGQFKQTGRLFHPTHQNDLGFTAFALLALLEDTDVSNKYKSEIEKGMEYLAENVDKENDIYALAIAIVALQKSQHPSAAKLKEKLEKLAHEENGLQWWTKSSTDTSNAIEITAYILESYVYSEPAEKLLPIIKWLIRNRNSMGGFDSTQDTIVGLQALIKFAEKYVQAADGEMTIKYQVQDGARKHITEGSFTVDKENSLVLQTHVLPKSARQIALEVEGAGSPLVQLSYRYNLAIKDNKPSFNVKHNIQKTDFPNLLKMNVCAEYVPGANSEIKESNMALMEIYLPSGFTADADRLENIRQVKQVQRVETKNSETAIIVYFDFLAAGQEVCLEVNAEKTHSVAKQKPAAITIYDYYNSDQRATVYYEVKSSLCDICDAGECGKGCAKTAD